MPCCLQPLSRTITRSFSGDSAIASGIDPRSYDTPAGSSRAPVGSREAPDASCAATDALTCEDGELQALASRASTNRQAIDDFIPPKMALTLDSASLIIRQCVAIWSRPESCPLRGKTFR